eukprot:407856_1
MELINHSIPTPIYGTFHAIIMDLWDSKLIVGFIRIYYCNISNKQLLANDLINLIVKFYGNDCMIYLMQTHRKQHWKIRLSDIMYKFEGCIKKYESKDIITEEMRKYKRIHPSFRSLVMSQMLSTVLNDIEINRKYKDDKQKQRIDVAIKMLKSDASLPAYPKKTYYSLLGQLQKQSNKIAKKTNQQMD